MVSVIVDRIFATLEQEGGAMYGAETVTQLQHALQCASHAKQSGADAELITAALLHDYGHLINRDDALAAAAGKDQFHEDVAADHLAEWFPPEVTEPIRLHVPAKRYLCAVDNEYFATLSPASVQSLAVQGGVFSTEEAAAFAANTHAEAATKLRRWDDWAKDPNAAAEPLETFRHVVEEALRPTE